MKKIIKRTFLIGLILTFSVGIKAQSDSSLAQLARKWENSATYMLKIAELMPEDKYSYAPVPEEMSFSEQLQHIAGNMLWLSSAHLKETPVTRVRPDKNMSKAKVIEQLKDAYAYALEGIKTMDPGKLDQMVKFFAGPMSKRQIIYLMHDHQTHHRGQIIVYLRLNGIKPPSYTGW